MENMTMKKAEMYWQTYLNLERELLELSKYIYITDEKYVYSKGSLIRESCKTQIETFSPHIADLIVRTCVEIEAISKELYFDLGGSKKRGDKDLFFDEDCLKILDIKCNSSKKIVMVTCPSFNLTEDSNKVFRPLREAHKRQGTDWESAYQAVKHDRYSSVSRGTVKNLIRALSALFLLNIYYRNEKIYSKYLEVNKLDFSFGSKIFSLKKPDQRYVIDVVNGKEISEILTSNDSPYILKYTDSIYKEVLEANKKIVAERKRYFESQEEFKEVAFINQLNQALEKEKMDPRQKVILSWELCKYRINKKIPSTLPFEERKRLFVGCDEFNGRIRQMNPHKQESELTTENIQQEIDSAGIMAGMELDNQFDRLREIKAFNEGYCELIIDRGDLKYK